MNVLLVTLDQFRADCLWCAGHPLVETPNLDRLAATGVRFASHFSQAAPCAPGRASLYTGLYQMNHRVVANGTPLEGRFDNVARLGRRAGYAPALFGYTDQGVDPSTVADPTDPRLDTYEGVLPGFDAVLPLDGRMEPWLARLESLGYGTLSADRALGTEPERPAGHSASAFLTEHLLAWIDRQDGPWFAHASYLRPHPPYAAAGRWATRYDPADVGVPLAPDPGVHRLVDAARNIPVCSAPSDPGAMAHLRAQYFGMVSEVDDQFGRVLDHLVGHRSGGGTRWWSSPPTTASSSATTASSRSSASTSSSYAIPCIVRAPGRAGTAGTVVEEFTEGVDVLPTLAGLLGQEVPAPCDGVSLVPFLDGTAPASVADRRPLGVGLAGHADGTPPHRRRPRPPTRAQQPRRRAQCHPRLRAIRRRVVALLRPGRRPRVAHHDHRPVGGAAPGPVDADVAVPAPGGRLHPAAARSRAPWALAGALLRLTATFRPSTQPPGEAPETRADHGGRVVHREDPALELLAGELDDDRRTLAVDGGEVLAERSASGCPPR